MEFITLKRVRRNIRRKKKIQYQSKDQTSPRDLPEIIRIYYLILKINVKCRFGNLYHLTKLVSILLFIFKLEVNSLNYTA